MAGTNVNIGGNGSGSSSGGGAPSTGSQLATASRMIFNDFISNSANNNTTLPWSAQNSGISAGNQTYLYAQEWAKSCVVFRGNASNANSGFSINPAFQGTVLGKGSYARAVVYFPDRGGVLNAATRFSIGYGASPQAPSISGNIRLTMELVNNEVLIIAKNDQFAATTYSTYAFSAIDTWLTFEIEYIERDEVVFSITNTETGVVLHTFTLNIRVPNADNMLESGNLVNFYAYGITSTAEAVTNLIAVDYIGFGTLE